MITLHSLVENLPKGVALHSENFFTVAGKACDKKTYLKARKDNEENGTDVETKQTTKHTEDFTARGGVNRFGKPCEITTANDNAKWMKSNEVESLTLQSKPAKAAELESTTIRWISKTLTDRQKAEIKTIRFKLALTKELSFTIDTLDRIGKLKNNPNCKPNLDNADLVDTLKNDSINFQNKLADILSEVANILNGTEVKESANIF